MLAGHPATSPSLPITQQSGPFVGPSYPPQYHASDANHAGVLLNLGIPSHFQYYRPIGHGQPIVPSQHHTHSTAPQGSYPNPSNQVQDSHPQYPDPANPSASVGHGSDPPPSSSSSSSAYVCEVCGATFTRSDNRKRHKESQHDTTIEHVCPYCQKSYARADSLKRHLDRPCDKMPQSA